MHVVPPTSMSSTNISILSLVDGPKEELPEEELSDYALDLDRLHMSDDRAIEKRLYEKKDVLRVNHHVHLRGLLYKKKGEYTLTYGEKSKLFVSSKSIEEQQVVLL